MGRDMKAGPRRVADRDSRAWRLVFSRIKEAAEAVAKGARPEDIARKFSRRVDPKDIVVWAQDYTRMSEAEFAAKHAKGTGRRSRPSSKGALSLKDAAVAARNEEHRLLVLERQLEQQLTAVRREKKDVQELLEFLDRKQNPQSPV